MSSADDSYSEFWKWCAHVGVVSKKLSIQLTMNRRMPELSLHLGETVRAGAILLTVPYLSTLNAQTIRGDLKPVAVPSLHIMCTFLTRRRRMDIITAKSLWLASCLACYRRMIEQGEELNISPLISRSLMPTLPSPFISSYTESYPAIAAAIPTMKSDDISSNNNNNNKSKNVKDAFLANMKAQTEGQLRVTHAALQFYQHRRSSHIPLRLIPSLDELRNSYHTVLHRSVLLPLDCIPSSPGDLSDLFTEKPDIEILPSFVPVIDIIRSPSTLQHLKNDIVKANCTLHTCSQADFISPGSRRRVLFETEPLSNRRVVVCASCDIKEGQELLLDYGAD